MKKLALVLTLALVLAFAVPVFANPFSDVPADHWAYDAISKLAADGVITGNPDGTYTGKKNLTRYEIAVIVAKAMAAAEANGDKTTAESQATINKLAAEFGSELAALGVKVAALEKKIGNVKFTGTARLRYVDVETKASGVTTGKSNAYQSRLRLVATATVNDKVTVVSRLVSEDADLGANNANRPVNADQFYVKYADKGLTVMAGRQDVLLGKGTIIDDTVFKGIIAAAPVGKYTVTAVNGRLDAPIAVDLTAVQIDGIKLFDKLTLGADWGKVNVKPLDADVKYVGVNFDYALAPKVNLWGEYVKSDADTNDKATWVGATFTELVKKTDLEVSYATLEANAYTPFTTHKFIGTAKDKVWKVSVDHALMPNTNLFVDYFDIKGQGDLKAKVLETCLEFKF